jgi:hypothetical protein
VVDAAVQANIANSGDINATQVTLSAGQAKDTLNRVVNNSGVIKATGFSSLNGEITLQGGTTLNSGTLDATSTTGNGGTVHMLGQHVGVVDSGSINVSGATGGGTILVGGDYQGKNTSIENAEVTYVGAQTTLKADATQNGNGGKVIVWADDTTRAYGSISAQGGALGGDGGFVETSGKQVLDVAGINVNAGVGGQWLLDPDAITILHQTGGNSFGGIYDPLGAVSTISDSSINAAINAGSSVTIQTTSLDGTGDITFDGSSGSGTGAIVIDKNSNLNSTLTINAYGKIVFKGDTTIQTSGSGGDLALVLMPDGQNVGGGNKINTSSSSTLTLNGAAGEVEVMIGGVNNVNTRGTWDNEGTVTLNGNSAIRFYDNGSGTRVGSFHNMPSTGILSINSSSGWSLLTATAPFVAGSSSQAGLVTNDGTINVNGTNGGSSDYTAWAILYNQGTTGVLNIGTSGASRTLSMQNGGAINGTISIANSAGKLNVSENHGVTSFSNLTFSGTGGTLNVSGTVGGTPTATFGGVKAPNVTLNIGVFSVPAGNVTISGNSIFNNVNYNSGTFAISNAKLGIAGGSYTVPSGVTYTGNVGYYAAGDLTIANNLSVPGALNLMAGWDKTIDLASAVTGSSIGHISLAASKSISSTGGNINIIAKTDFTPGLGSSILASGNRWLIWVPNPNAIIGNCGTGSGCLASFAQYGASFASNPTVLGTGNGLMYSDTLSLTSTLGGAVSKVYDGSNTISLTGATFGPLHASPADSGGGALYHDVISPFTTTGGTGTLSSINVGTGISVTATGMTLNGITTSSATGSIPVYGYSFTASGNIGEVTPAAASPISLSGSRAYDGTNIVDASIFSLSGLVGSETLTLSGSGTVADKNVGTNKSVSLGSLSLGNGSGSASNYTFTGGTWLASITPASISVSGITAADRAYNSTTAATLNTSGISFGGLMTGDVLSVSATGAFINKNVGVGKTVNISGITLTGADAGNYILASTTASTTATISPATLSISGVVADNKVYDGTASANLSSVGSIAGVFSGDSLGNVTGATAAFSDSEIGVAKLVNFSLLFDGIDASNYIASGTTTANITKASSSTDDVVNVITDLTQPENYDTQGNQDNTQGNQDNSQAKQGEQDDTVTHGVLQVLTVFENNQTEKEALITEQPKGRTLQCSFNK